MAAEMRVSGDDGKVVEKPDVVLVEGNNGQVPAEDKIHQHNAHMYHEALERYPNDEAIDQTAERRLRRKLDMRIIPLLGICYFFYVSRCFHFRSGFSFSSWRASDPRAD
jgi:hypothetical protein